MVARWERKMVSMQEDKPSVEELEGKLQRCLQGLGSISASSWRMRCSWVGYYSSFHLICHFCLMIAPNVRRSSDVDSCYVLSRCVHHSFCLKRDFRTQLLHGLWGFSPSFGYKSQTLHSYCPTIITLFNNKIAKGHKENLWLI